MDGYIGLLIQLTNMNRNCYRFLRVSWALSEISCIAPHGGYLSTCPVAPYFRHRMDVAPDCSQFGTGITTALGWARRGQVPVTVHSPLAWMPASQPHTARCCPREDLASV